MKQKLTLIMFLVIMLGMFTSASADIFTIGTGTSTTSYLPTYGFYDYSWSKTIYLGSEMTTAGMAADTEITGIGYYVGNTPANFVSLDQRIYLRQTTQAIYGTVTDETGSGYPNNANFTLVYQSDYTFNGGGWHYFTFTQPFVWDGTSNIEILYESWDTNGVTGSPTFRYTSTSTNYRGVYKYQDVTFPTTAGTRSYLRPNITFVTPSLDPPSPAIIGYPADNNWSFLNGTLIWNDGGGMPTSYNVYLGTSPTPDFIQNQTATTYTPTLEPGTTYYWQIVPENANGPAEGSPVWSFRTPTATQIAESFDATAFPPAGWNTPGAAFTRSTTTPFYGTASAYESIAAGPSYLHTPMLELNETSSLDWYMRTSTTSGIGRVQIVYSTDGIDWINIGDEIVMPTATTWMPYSVDLSSLAGNNYIIGFKVYSSTTTASVVYIDHVFGPEPAAVAPGPVTQILPADLATGVYELPTLTWSAPSTGGIATGYYVYLDTNADPSTLVGTTASLTYTSTIALDYATTYYWKVVANNASGDSEGNPIRSFTVRDDPTLYPPFTQDFTTVPPTNWMKKSGLLVDPIVLTSTTSGWTADGFANVGTTGAAKLNIFSTTAKYWLVTPPINLGTGGAGFNLEFNLALTDYGTTAAPDLTGTDDKFAVVISTDGGATWNTANILRLWDNAGSPYVYNNISITGELVTLSLTEYTGTVAIGFYGESTISNADNDLFVDNMAILPAGAPPTAPTTGIPANSASDVFVNTNFSWSGASGNPTGYLVNLGTSAESMVQVADLAESTYNPTENLAYSTTYFWRVDAYSSFGTTPGTVWQFTTQADPTIYAGELPYTQNFDGVTAPVLPSRWTSIFSSTSTSAYVRTYTTSTPRSTPNHLQLTNSADASANLVLVSPPIDPALSGLRTKFWAKGSTNYTLLVGTVDDNNVFTLFQTVGLTSTYTEYTVDFSAYAGTDQKIGYKHGLGGTYRSIYIDDLLIEAIPTSPVFSITPATKNYGTITIGSSASQVFTISNTGLGTLGILGIEINGANTDQYSMTDSNTYPKYLASNESMIVTVTMQPTAEGVFSANLQVTTDLAEAIRNIALSGTGSDSANTGGGNTTSSAGGYYFANNVSITAISTPAYSWVNLTTNEVTEPVTSGTLDDGYWTVPLGMEFLYYGNVYTSVNIATNGFINFGTGATTFSNVAIPSVGSPNNAIYLFWDDLEYYPGTSHIYYGISGDSFVITYTNMGRTGSAYNPAASVTAQIVLLADGRFKLTYQDITGTATTHTPTIGIENIDGTKGIQYHLNGVGGPYQTAAKGGGITIMFGEDFNTLPVELSSFTATLTSEMYVMISWTAQSETNHSGYNIYRGEANGLDSAFKLNSQIIDDGVNLGTQISYSYTDFEAYNNMQYYYWLETVSLDGVCDYYGPLTIVIGNPNEEPQAPEIPVVTALLNAFPNPFNPYTNLRYSLKEVGNVNIDIYNVKGQLIRSFKTNHDSPGFYHIAWDGRDNNGQVVSSGIYMYRMTSGNYSSIKKVIMSK